MKNNVTTSTSNRYNQFDDSEQPAILTIGSGRRISHRQKPFPAALYTHQDEESHEMSSRSGKNTYNVDVGRTGSEDSILDTRNEDPTQIRCTTEVTVNSVEKGRGSSSRV